MPKIFCEIKNICYFCRREKGKDFFENKLGTHILMLSFSLCALSGNEKLIFKNIKICHK